MEHPQLVAETRTSTGKEHGRKLRKAGKIPAVAYGLGVEKPMWLSLPSKETATLVNRRACKATVVDLVVNGQAYPAILKEYQVHPVERTLVHLDFVLVKADQQCRAEVPVETTGRSIGEEAGAKLFIARREVSVRCLPHQVPEKVVIDVTPLNMNDVVYVDQVPYPEGVTPVYKTRYPVLVVQKLKVVEEVTAKPAEEGAEGAEGAAPAEGAEGAAAAAPAGGDKKKEGEKAAAPEKGKK